MSGPACFFTKEELHNDEETDDATYQGSISLMGEDILMYLSTGYVFT
jgi:hypothetical protein